MCIDLIGEEKSLRRKTEAKGTFSVSCVSLFFFHDQCLFRLIEVNSFMTFSFKGIQACEH